MLKNLLALFKTLTRFSFPRVLLVLMCIVLCSFLVTGFLSAQAGNTDPGNTQTRWYVSNAAGMTLRHVSSRLEALRHDFALSVDIISANDIPAMLLPYFQNGFIVETRILYENREPLRQQWIFRNQRGIAQLNASGLYSDEVLFIEVYNDNYFLIEERQFIPDFELLTRYFYSNSVLVRAENWIIEEGIEALNNQSSNRAADFTDFYRYTRSGSLRAMERIFHSSIQERSNELVRFPGFAPGTTREPEFASPPGQIHSIPLISNVNITEDTRVNYTTDSRGRLLTETWYDENNEIIAKLQNTWTGDRLSSVYRRSDTEDSLTEYEYDSDGSRILERNYNNGILERVVRSEGSRDIEEIYVGGRVNLRAVWEDGRKISEERVR